MTRVIVSAPLDQLRSGEFRFLQEAARLGELHVLLWPDEAVRALTGRTPKFPLAERRYVLQAVRYVTAVHAIEGPVPADALPAMKAVRPDLWVIDEAHATPERKTWCAAHGLACRVLTARTLAGFPEPPPPPPSRRPKVIVTGCYDVLHSGHVRFFEEVAELGDLYVALGHDENIRLLKGPGHPLCGEAERRYMVGSIRHVRQALISSGMAWLDAEPEIAKLKPDIYAVNEDGDRPEKREFCQTHGIRYVVLKRLPKPGLARRSSTDLRGF
jgi:cytidyltransferase-like protein